MIRHRPRGLGHPYRLEPDQRVPVDPVAGEPIELRATTPWSIAGLAVELQIGGRTERLPAELVTDELVADELVADEPAASDEALQPRDGHLSAAASRAPALARAAWVVRLAPLPAGTRVRYAFIAEGGWRSRRFEFTVAGWRADAGRLVVTAAGGAGDQTGGDRPASSAGAVTAVPETDRLVPGSVAWLCADAGPLRLRFALRLERGAHVVGFGERFDHLDQAGRRLDATVFEQYKGQGNRTYLPVPFAIVVPGDGSPGWGLHLRTSRRTWYDVGATDPERLWIEVALDPADLDPTVELALYAGTPADVLAAFLAEIGRPTLPPAWVYHLWMSGNEWDTQARVRAEVERSLAEGIPVGVVVIEAWSDETTFVAFRDARYAVHPDGAPHRLADFAFPPDGAWPDPKGLVDWLHTRGIRVLLWQVPLLKAHPAPQGQARADRDTMVARGYAVREADGRPYRNRGWWFPGALLPDWTNPDAKRWWLEKRRYLVEEVGIDGFKTDGGEHAWGDGLRYADGTRGAETNNRYPLHYAAAYHELLRSCGRRPVTFSRAGFTGAGAVPLHWAGDEDSTWAAFRAAITAGLTAGASGIFFWGWDLAGFSGEIPSAELYLRAAAMAAFCPIMQYHSEFNRHRRPSRDRTPWNIAERTSDPRVLPTFRRFAQIRERLVPYLADQARRAVATSRPLMRALCFEWPADPQIWDVPYQYLLGDALLVAPVVEPGATDWEVYLPAGRWVDLWTGAAVEGGRRVTRAVPLEIIPVFRRADAEEVPDLPGLA